MTWRHNTELCRTKQKHRRQVPVTVAAAHAPKSRVPDLERLRNETRPLATFAVLMSCDRSWVDLTHHLSQHYICKSEKLSKLFRFWLVELVAISSSCIFRLVNIIIIIEMIKLKEMTCISRRFHYVVNKKESYERVNCCEPYDMLRRHVSNAINTRVTDHDHVLTSPWRIRVLVLQPNYCYINHSFIQVGELIFQEFQSYFSKQLIFRQALILAQIMLWQIRDSRWASLYVDTLKSASPCHQSVLMQPKMHKQQVPK